METIDIVTIVLMFAAVCIGTVIARLFNPGIYLIYAQTFASGAFIGISLLHFLPIAVKNFDPFKNWSMYSIVMAMVFIIFSLLEVRTGESASEQTSAGQEVSDDDKNQYSMFLMHHFAVIPSFSMQVAVFFFLAIHSVIIGFVMSFDHDSDTHISILIATIIEKMIESFTVTIMVRKDLTRVSWFWVSILVYSAITPLTIIIITLAGFHKSSLFVGICMSISAGVFLFIGLLLWKRTFMTPFDWKKKEIVIVCLIFIMSIAIEALTCIT